jgi:Domain of unknown function (DUF4349)
MTRIPGRFSTRLAAAAACAGSPDRPSQAPEEYQGFLGQIERGWDALGSVVGSLVLLFALLLPWLGVMAVIGAIGYAALRLVKARRP